MWTTSASDLWIYIPIFLWKIKILYFSVDRSLPQPIGVDACEFYCKDNAKSHHTENYDLLEGKDPSPIFRRGEPFYFAIRFNRPFNMDTDSVKLELTFGKVFERICFLCLHVYILKRRKSVFYTKFTEATLVICKNRIVNANPVEEIFHSYFILIFVILNKYFWSG